MLFVLRNSFHKDIMDVIDVMDVMDIMDVMDVLDIMDDVKKIIYFNEIHKCDEE